MYSTTVWLLVLGPVSGLDTQFMVGLRISLHHDLVQHTHVEVDKLFL